MALGQPVARRTAASRSGADHLAPDCRGQNFYRLDRPFRDLLDLGLAPELRRHLEPHLDRLGELAGGRLDELAGIADKNPPELHARDRFGRDEDWIDYHPAYREMEAIAFGELGLHAMSHRGGVLGWPKPFPATAKYAFQYLFVQAEFGLMCPVSVSDTSNYIVMKYGDRALKDRLADRILSQDPARLWKGTQFMTEKAGGSDVGAIESVARLESGEWRLHGEKWFCSHADADYAVLLARPEGRPAGTAGLGLFAMPRRLEDGSRNRYRIVRLKDKLGTRSMASGEIRLEGALAWPIGQLERGFKQMMDQVNLSRLSHGVRAAAMMRRCLNEAMQVAGHRMAFGRRLIDMPLVRRQLLKIMTPTEQALSMYAMTARAMERAEAGDAAAARLLRILTPLYKFRACRDNIKVATAAMEMRGGNGYIEDWPNARLLRDAQIGVLWEGTSNINALDVVQRAVGKSGADADLGTEIMRLLGEATRLPERLRDDLRTISEKALGLARRAAKDDPQGQTSRLAASALYHAATAAHLAWEASAAGNGQRLLIARAVIDHRLLPQDPLSPPMPDARQDAIAAALLGGRALDLAEALDLLGA